MIVDNSKLITYQTMPTVHVPTNSNLMPLCPAVVQRFVFLFVTIMTLTTFSSVLRHDNKVIPTELAASPANPDRVSQHLQPVSPHLQPVSEHVRVTTVTMAAGSASDNEEIIVELEGNNKVRARSGRNRLAAVLVVLVVLLTLIVVLCITVKAKVVLTVLSDKPITPDSDYREYRVIQLTNTMVVTLISDPDTRTASTSINVAVGSLCNPDDVLGLAHYLEHMLFMGTEKYPQENRADKYASDNDGWINAWTDDTNTNYHFLVESSALKNMTDIYAQFFISPLMRKDSLQREMLAVQSEYMMGFSVDFWPEYEMMVGNANPESPYSR